MQTAPNLFLKYNGINPKKTSDIDLFVLGKSIQGFDELIRKLISNVMKIDGDIEIRAVQVGDGSILIKILVALSTPTPFHNQQDYFNFLQLADQNAFQALMTQLGVIHQKINDFGVTNPADLMVFYELLRTVIVKLIRIAQKQKKKLSLEGDGYILSKDYALRLKRLISQRAFKKALTPFVEGEVSKIEVATDESFKDSAKITDQNFGELLSDSEEILPEWKNGNVVELQGSIVGIQCSRGESLKFKVKGLPRRYQLLVAHPAQGKTTKDYADYYGSQVSLLAEIYRKNLFQKPSLLIKNIHQLESQITDQIPNSIQ